VSSRGLAILATICLIAGLVAVSSGIGVGLAPVYHSFPTDKGILVADCGQPWPPRGADPLFQFEPDVMAAVESDSPGMRDAKIATMQAECQLTRTVMANLMIGLGVGGVALVGLGGLLLLIRNLRGRRPQQWPPAR
jgi:hypothetical protein